MPFSKLQLTFGPFLLAVYTLFGCCEYAIVFANIFYHGTAELDFQNYCVGIARGDLLQEEKRSN